MVLFLLLKGSLLSFLFCLTLLFEKSETRMVVILKQDPNT